ncbi:MAG: LLM class flavin-dependent oxidoreductase [Acetobacteraceae bacterium]|nr:LLM class flavin-dependent oxidoreductase [Acetobacteraceae bacterium]
MELWTTGVASPRASARAARQLEDAGWAGFQVVDSQNLSGDPYVALAMAATATSTLGLATGVTNTVTRHASVTACSIASVQRISNGRAFLGIGRGDSALAHLGRGPARLASFERYLRHLRIYLRGEAVPFDEIDIPTNIAPPMSELELADAPPSSQIGWLSGGGPVVPIEVAASGPRVIAIAAVHADRIMFALGADAERLAWGIAQAKEARVKAGLDPNGIAFGAYVNAACHEDIAIARNLVRGSLTTFARFNVMHGTAAGPVSDSDRAVLRDLHDSYDMRAHTRGDSRQAGVLTESFIDRFAIVGPPARVTERLHGLTALGLDKIVITGAMRGVSESDAAVAKQTMEKAVLPSFQS